MSLSVLGRHLLRISTSRTGTRGSIGIRIAGIRRSAVDAGLGSGLNNLGNHFVGELLQLIITRQALQQRHRPTGNQCEQCRRPLHLQCLCDRRISRDVNAGELNLAIETIHRIAQRASHREKTVVSGHPQQQQNRERGGGLHHRLEGVLGGVDHIATSCRCAASLSWLSLDLMLQRFQIDSTRQRYSWIELLLISHICLHMYAYDSHARQSNNAGIDCSADSHRVAILPLRGEIPTT